MNLINQFKMTKIKIAHDQKITSFLSDFFIDVCQNPTQLQKQYLCEKTGLTQKQLKSWFRNKRVELKRNRAQTKNALLLLQNNISSLFVAAKRNEAARVIDKLVCQISDSPKNAKHTFEIFKDDEKSPEKALESCDELIGDNEENSNFEEDSFLLLSDDRGPEICLPLFFQNALEFIDHRKNTDETYQLLWKINCQK